MGVLRGVGESTKMLAIILYTFRDLEALLAREDYVDEIQNISSKK